MACVLSKSVPRWLEMASRWRQDLPDGFKIAQNTPKMTSRGLHEAPRWLKNWSYRLRARSKIPILLWKIDIFRHFLKKGRKWPPRLPDRPDARFGPKTIEKRVKMKCHAARKYPPRELQDPALRLKIGPKKVPRHPRQRYRKQNKNCPKIPP